jgi:uncharacterized lipoprotein NlpE involved in copper resistance
MSFQETSTDPSRTDGGCAEDRSNTSAAGTALDQARQVGATNREQASAVASTAVDSSKQVAAEAKHQARYVTNEVRGSFAAWCRSRAMS